MKWDDTFLTRLDEACEPTPDVFHQAVEQKLTALRRQESRPVRCRPARAALVAILCLALLLGTALALNRLGVLYFLTERVAYGPDEATVEPGVVSPLGQSCDSTLVDAEVRDLWMDNGRLAVCFHLEPKDGQSYRLLSATDIGQDGEQFDRIWWQGDILTFDQWLPEGKQMLVIDPQFMEVGGVGLLGSLDWLPEEQGETFCMEGDLSRLKDRAAVLNPDGTLTVTIALDVTVYGTDKQETATLTATLQAPDGFVKEEE